MTIISNNKILPINWISATIEMVCTQPQYGYTTKASGEGNIKLLRTTDITSGKINWHTVPYCLTNPKDLEKYLLKDGDIVISRAGSVGVSHLIQNPEKAVFASYLIRFNPLIEKKFFKYFLDSPFYWQNISEKKLGIAVPNVNATKIKNIKINVPPLPEQHRIVAKIEELFSELDNGVENLKKAQQQLKVYRQAVLKYAFEGKLTEEWRKKNTTEPAEKLLTQIKEEREKHYQQQLKDWQQSVIAWDAQGRKGKKPAKPKKPKELPPLTEAELADLPEGWKWTYFEFIGQWNGGGTPSKARKEFWENGSINWVSPKDMKSKYIVSTQDKITECAISESSTKYIARGSILFVVRSGILRRILPSAIIKEPSTVNQDMQALTPYLAISEYLYWYAVANEFDIRRKCAKDGTTVESIETNLLKSYHVPLCSVEEQKQIIQEIESRLSVVEKLEQTIEENLQKAEALRQSILKKAFEGKLVPQNPDDEPTEQLLERIRQDREIEGVTEMAAKDPQASKGKQLTLDYKQ